MCCDPTFTENENKLFKSGICPECGEDVDDDGDTVALDNCNYSPVVCTTCGRCPCDWSC